MFYLLKYNPQHKRWPRNYTTVGSTIVLVIKEHADNLKQKSIGLFNNVKMTDSPYAYVEERNVSSYPSN